MTSAVEAQQRATSPQVRFRARLIAEAVGTGLLVVAVVGSGIAAERLSDDTGLQLLVNAIATGTAITVLIVVLQPVSAAFNPVVTLLERLTRTISTGQSVVTIAVQVVGGAAGAVVANMMFSEPAISIATTNRTGPGLWLAEVVATAGLVLTIAALTWSGRSHHIGWAVGAYITAAYWFTSSTSFANPAVTIARTLTDTFAGINPASVSAFLACQIIGGALGYLTARILYPPPRTPMTDKPSVLFVCVHNAGRSQMAAGYLRHLAGDAIEVRSAGSEPADRINPVAVQAMAEEGIDIAAEQPKILTTDAVKASDVVITMGCGDTCPFYPGKRYKDWVLDDPAGQDLDHVRPLRDQIRQRIETLIAELLPART